MKLKEINYDFNKSVEIEILNPSTNQSFEIPAFISVMSLESTQGRQAQVSIYREMIELNNPTDKEVRDITAKYLSSLLVGWKGIQDDEGNEIVYSEDTARELLVKYDILFDAVNAYSSNMGKFLKE